MRSIFKIKNLIQKSFIIRFLVVLMTTKKNKKSSKNQKSSRSESTTESDESSEFISECLLDYRIQQSDPYYSDDTSHMVSRNQVESNRQCFSLNRLDWIKSPDSSYFIAKAMWEGWIGLYHQLGFVENPHSRNKQWGIRPIWTVIPSCWPVQKFSNWLTNSKKRRNTHY